MTTKKEFTRYVSRAITFFCIAFAICCVALLAYVTATLFAGKTVSFFGYSLHVVVTDSMTPEINVDDVVIAKKTSTEDIKVGDDIVFVSSDPMLKGNTVVHRVVGINADGSFKTSGIKTGATVDPYPATKFIGVVKKVSGAISGFMAFTVKYKNIIFAVLMLAIVAIAASEVVRIAVIKRKGALTQESDETDSKPTQKSDEAALREELRREIMRERGLTEATPQAEKEGLDGVALANTTAKGTADNSITDSDSIYSVICDKTTADKTTADNSVTSQAVADKEVDGSAFENGKTADEESVQNNADSVENNAYSVKDNEKNGKDNSEE